MDLSDLIDIKTPVTILTVFGDTREDYSGTGWKTIPLDSLGINTISGASLSSDQLTLPAGDYLCILATAVARTDGTKSAIYNVTDAEYPAVGHNNYNENSDGQSTDQNFDILPFSLDSSCVMEFRLYIQSNSGSKSVPQIRGSQTYGVLTATIIRYGEGV
jgi:hypothetical protein